MDFLAISFAVLGLVAGLMLWSRLVYVSYGIYSALKNVDLRVQFKNPTTRQISSILLALVAVSCGWVLAFGAVALHFHSSAESGWGWFFGGVAATPALVTITTTRALRRLRALKAQGVQP